jgi:hypothetical protein
LAPHYKFRKEIVPTPPPPLATEPPTCDDKPKSKNIPWAWLLVRVFDIDVETCPSCGGRLKIIAAIEEPEVIKKILSQVLIPSGG